MKKGGIIALIVLIIVAVCVVGLVFYQNSTTKTESENTQEPKEATTEKKDLDEENLVSKNETIDDEDEDEDKNEVENTTEKTSSGSKILVAYFSGQGHTKKVAEEIADELDADIFEIEPEEEYTEKDLDWTDSNSRVNKEHENESLRDVDLKTTKVPNWDEYDTVLIGYPIWWGIAAWPTNSFVKANNFTGKTVYAFCTSLSSGLGQSMKLLEDDAKGGDWKEGHRFSSSASTTEIKSWVDSLGL